MSFNSFSPEVLMKIFSHLLDVPSKIRLERVSRKFRDCIRNADSWRNNTELVIDDATQIEEVHRYLSLTPVITKLTLYDCSEPGILGCLWSYSDKLKVTHFTYGPMQDRDDCEKNQQIVACCLGKFTQSLRRANLTCCRLHNCDTLAAFASMLGYCKNLEHLALGAINDDEGRDDEDQEEANYILDFLKNMCLQSIRLTDFEASHLNGARLAAVFNTANRRSLSSLTIEDNIAENEEEEIVFRLNHFCEHLEPAAANAIRTLWFTHVQCGWAQILPMLPALMQNLCLIVIEETVDRTDSADEAMNKAQTLGNFMHACLARQGIIQLKLDIKCSRTFSRRFWKAVDLVEVARTGTKRTQEEHRWKRTLRNGIATIDINVH